MVRYIDFSFGDILANMVLLTAKMRSVAPVSYTHLDVYKRQVLPQRAWRKRWTNRPPEWKQLSSSMTAPLLSRAWSLSMTACRKSSLRSPEPSTCLLYTSKMCIRDRAWGTQGQASSELLEAESQRSAEAIRGQNQGEKKSRNRSQESRHSCGEYCKGRVRPCQQFTAERADERSTKMCIRDSNRRDSNFVAVATAQETKTASRKLASKAIAWREKIQVY